ncbi:hypothetical protein EIP86_005339 [Pleurotus ostreatoroseus]|nr:hypothetical protein EIP86_005339 [Pleurotus ostreatoroseus]
MKKAVCIGVSYPGTKHHLHKAHDDALKMRDLLKNRYDYTDVKLLLDSDRPDVDARPTRKHILRAIDDLVKGVSKGDRLVFHFTGHGTQQIEKSTGDRPREDDDQDELIWPEDAVMDTIKDKYGNDSIRNAILDNEIHDKLVEKMPTGAHLTIIFDCCHSGTAAGERIQVSISACSDAQETLEFDTVGGLLVHYLYQVLAYKKFVGSYQELFEELDRLLEGAYEKLKNRAREDKAAKIRNTLANGDMHPIFSILGSHETTMKFSF